jgi:hypothetical protein
METVILPNLAGGTSPRNADIYECVARGRVIPGIEAMRIEDFRHIDVIPECLNPGTNRTYRDVCYFAVSGQSEHQPAIAEQSQFMRYALSPVPHGGGSVKMLEMARSRIS